MHQNRRARGRARHPPGGLHHAGSSCANGARAITRLHHVSVSRGTNATAPDPGTTIPRDEAPVRRGDGAAPHSASRPMCRCPRGRPTEDLMGRSRHRGRGPAAAARRTGAWLPGDRPRRDHPRCAVARQPSSPAPAGTSLAVGGGFTWNGRAWPSPVLVHQTPDMPSRRSPPDPRRASGVTAAREPRPRDPTYGRASPFVHASPVIGVTTAREPGVRDCATA